MLNKENMLVFICSIDDHWSFRFFALFCIIYMIKNPFPTNSYCHNANINKQINELIHVKFWWLVGN